MDLPKSFPFTRLRIPQGEQVLWSGYNPTFYRFINYGFVVTHSAIYLCHRCWWRIARWTRISLDDVVQVEVIGDQARPELRIQKTDTIITFNTPFDFYSDEMDFDRKVLEKASAAILAAKASTKSHIVCAKCGG